MNSQEIGLNKATSLIEELSDEEAGACVGGLLNGVVDLVNDVINPVDHIVEGTTGGVAVEVTINALEVGYDSSNSARMRHGTRSDRNLKANFATVNVQDILGKVATLPIETWNYKDQNATIRHIGPMAQDFAAAFGVGEDNRFINTVDANGVALAAIQALYKRIQNQDAEMSAMSAQLNTLKQQMREIKGQIPGAMPVSAF